MNVWLAAALALVVAMAPLGAICLRAGVEDGLVALEMAGVTAALVLLLLAEGLERQPFADLALVLAVLSFTGALAFVYVLERRA